MMQKHKVSAPWKFHRSFTAASGQLPEAPGRSFLHHGSFIEVSRKLPEDSRQLPEDSGQLPEASSQVPEDSGSWLPASGPWKARGKETPPGAQERTVQRTPRLTGGPGRPGTTPGLKVTTRPLTNHDKPGTSLDINLSYFDIF